MTEPNQNNDSLKDSLKEAGEALLNAGGRLGDVLSEFTTRFKDDRDPATPAGRTNAAGLPEDNETLVDQIKQAAARARASFSEASNADQYKTATASFAGDAENIFRDIAGSVSRAAQGTKDSAEVEDARASFNEAIGQVRETFEQGVRQVRERNNAAGDQESEGFIAEMRERLEGLIARASESVNQKTDEAADIVEGEVVKERDPKEDNL